MKKLLQRLKAEWLRLFGADRKLETDVRKVISVLMAIRKAINNPGVNVLINVIPGNVDDKIVQAVRLALNKVLGVADAFGLTPDILPTNELQRNAILHKTASVAVSELHGLSEKDADTLVQIVFSNTKL